MSTTNQYYMYGIALPYNKELANLVEKDDYEDDICGLFSGRDGSFIILGKILYNNPLIGEYSPYEVPELDGVDEVIIQTLVKQRYGITGNFHYYFIANRK
jgi:hypothetical protein